MNKVRHAAIARLVEQLEALQSTLESIREEAEELKNEEQEYFDLMPESLQGREKGAAAERAVTYFDDADSEFDTAIQAVSDIISNLEEASQ